MPENELTQDQIDESLAEAESILSDSELTEVSGPLLLSSDQPVVVSSDAVILAVPDPDQGTSTVSSNDLLTFVGSGAHDFIAYRIGDNESFCVYPVRISDTGRVTGEDCTTITITTSYQTRSVVYGTDDVSLTLDGSSYVYSDQTGPYITLWNASVARSPLDYLSSYLLIAFCLLSIFGTLVRRSFQ